MRGARHRVAAPLLAVYFACLGAGCGGGSDGDAVEPSPTQTRDDLRDESAPEFVRSVRDAIDAIEAELGSGQRYFEVTANDQFVNVFVAVEDGTAAVPYLFVDGELQPPAPQQDGASGFTFAAPDVRFDEALVLSGVRDELPDTSIDALSVYGDGNGAIYVLGATSEAGGLLDVQVTATGDVIAVDPA